MSFGVEKKTGRQVKGDTRMEQNGTTLCHLLPLRIYIDFFAEILCFIRRVIESNTHI